MLTDKEALNCVDWEEVERIDGTKEGMKIYPSIHGRSHLGLNKDDISHIQNGGLIAYNDGEYSTIIGLVNKKGTQ